MAYQYIVEILSSKQKIYLSYEVHYILADETTFLQVKTTIKAGNTLKHQATVWPVPYACVQPYHPGSGSHGQHSRPQRLRSFWSASWIVTSGQIQQRKFAIHERLSVTLRMLRVKSDKSDWFWSQSIVFTKPFKTGLSLDLARGSSPTGSTARVICYAMLMRSDKPETPGGTRYILGWGGAARPHIPWPCLRQISLIFPSCLRQNSDSWYPV